jgi:choline/glycine/proline betaine transport protein
MTLRSTLYPILGKYTWGWIGDFVDGFTIVVTVAGVCTSLGLGAMQIMAGLQRVGWVDSNISDDARNNGLIGIIWVVTIIATVSVIHVTIG